MHAMCQVGVDAISMQSNVVDNNFHLQPLGATTMVLLTFETTWNVYGTAETHGWINYIMPFKLAPTPKLKWELCINKLTLLHAQLPIWLLEIHTLHS